MDGNLRENDPYNNMETGEEGVRPGFLRRNTEKIGQAGTAVATLRKAESGASVKAQPVVGGADAAAKNENSVAPRGLFTGNGKALAKTKDTDFKGKLKKFGPIGAIIALIVGVGGLMMGAQTLMPVAISEMIIEKFNSIGVSSTTASDAWLDSQLNRAAGVVENKAGDVGADLFDLTDHQLQAFDIQGIRVVKAENGKVLALLYEKNNEWVPVVGSQLIGQSDLVNRIKVASGINNIGTPVVASVAFQDRNFKTLYTTAAKSWRGGSSGWFDQIMANITETKLSINRNRWTRFFVKALDSADNSFKKLAESSAMKNTSNRDSNFYDDVEVDDDGNKVLEREVIEDVDVEGEGNRNVSNSNVDADGSNTKVALTNKALKAAAAVGDIASGTCAVLEGVMSIYTVVSAYQSIQFLNLISGFLESVDKMKAGYGESSPISDYSTNLTVLGETKDTDGNTVATKTAMESEGMAWLFSRNSTINQNDQSVKNVNFENIMSNTSALFGNMALTAQVYEACGYVRAGTGLINLGMTIVSFIPIAGQAIKIAQVAISVIKKVVVSAAVAMAISAIVPIATKNLVAMLTKNAATEWFGEDLGNAMISGANKYLGGNGTSGGQSPGSRAKVLAYFGVRDTVIADEAEYQREIRNPFDASSRYTFMGSLAYSLLPLAYSGNSVASAIKNVSNMVGGSLVAVLPTASAIDNQSVITSTGNCDLLRNVDAVGDAFCNAYEITDVSTIMTVPFQTYKDAYYLKGYYDTWVYICNRFECPGWTIYRNSPTYSASFSGGSVVTPERIEFKSDGKMLKHEDVTNPEDGDRVYEWYSNNIAENGDVIDKSNLAKYITYCGQRTSQYGVKDATIADRLLGQNSSTAKIIGYIPVLNDVQDIVNGMKEQTNMDWVTGKACVATDSNEHWDNEYKYYQRYAENERLLESTKPGYKSEITAYLEEYYKENPIDDSFEGTLARFSGMTVEQVDNTLALMEYYEFIEEYDASGRYAFGEPVVNDDGAIFFENASFLAHIYYIVPEDVVYADVRNRVFVV